MMAAVHPSPLATPKLFYSKSHPLFDGPGSQMQVPNDLHPCERAQYSDLVGSGHPSRD